jgi:c-di-GMP-binding flagellar brake protein YcgR
VSFSRWKSNLFLKWGKLWKNEKVCTNNNASLHPIYEESGKIEHPEYRRGVVKDYSAGGLRIVTEKPLSKCSVVLIEIPLETEAQELKIIQIHGVVRWTQECSGRQTMGIELFEFKESGDEDFVKWMSRL